VSKDSLIWLPEITEKLQEKHGVEQKEVEQVFAGKPRYFRGPKGKRRDENVYYAFGQTAGERYLVVTYIKKKDAGR